MAFLSRFPVFGSRGTRATSFRTAAVGLGSLALVWLAACAKQPPVPLRPEPIPYADTLPIVEPANRELLETPLLVREALSGQVAAGISIRRAVGRSHEALNVTRFDDVVNSAWFEHRNDRARLTPEETFRGPTTGTGPDTTAPIILTQAKLQGISPGFHIRDAGGARYVVKFDPKGFQYLSSAAGVIVNRLMYAAGYHVPEDYIFLFRREHIGGVEDGATYQDAEFIEHPLTLDLVDEILAQVDTLPDGRFLAVASEYVPGPPKGPFLFSGTREDDPNDYYRHEHRRDLRGLYVVSSWVNHVDMRFMNTMDAFVPPGYIRHYLIDFAASLGSGTIRPHQPREGAEYNFDFWPTMARVLTLGFYRQGWEGEPLTVIHPSIGWMQVETFFPAGWKANWPNEAFVNMTARDAYWGAKLVGSFSDRQIRAAVAAGQLPDGFASDTLADILAYRRDRIVRHWYRQVTPIERPVVEPGSPAGTPEPGFVLRFDDLGIRDGAWPAEGIVYEWALEGAPRGGRREGASAAAPRGAVQRLRVQTPEGAGSGRSADSSPSGADAIATLTVRVRFPESGRDAADDEAIDATRREAKIFLRWLADEGRYRVVGLEH